MRSFSLSSLVTFALLAAQIHAAPHTLDRRDNVCALNLRTAANGDCLVGGHGTSFTLTPPSTITSSAVTAIPANAQCDHIVELQLLDGALQKSGVCNMIVAMIAAKPGVSKASLLQPLSDVINGASNLKFLQSNVNNQKKTVVQRSLKSTAQGSTDLDKAVGNYLQQTKASSNAIASALDTKVAAIIAQARTIVAALPADPTTRRAKTPKADLTKAIAAAASGGTAVSHAWASVLGSAPHT